MIAVRAAKVAVTLEYEDGSRQEMLFHANPQLLSVSQRRAVLQEPGGDLVPAPSTFFSVQGETLPDGKTFSGGGIMDTLREALSPVQGLDAVYVAPRVPEAIDLDIYLVVDQYNEEQSQRMWSVIEDLTGKLEPWDMEFHPRFRFGRPTNTVVPLSGFRVFDKTT